jgi:hypothetical protein
MRLRRVGTVIARRELVLDGRPRRTISVILGRPRRFPRSRTFRRGSDYYCPYQIRGLGNEPVTYAGGVDAVQALYLALVGVGARLERLNREHRGRLQWLGGPPGHYGLPSIRGLLRDLRRWQRAASRMSRAPHSARPRRATLRRTNAARRG